MDAQVADPPRWRSLPPEVVAEVEARRAAVLAGARGPVLDLDDPAGRARLRTHSQWLGDDSPGERFASIVCTGALVEEPDLARSVRALATLLADDGELFVIEP